MRCFFKNIFRSFYGKGGLIVGFTALSYALLINNLNLWSDEIYSVLMARDSLPEMFYLLMTEDSKPPLYYLYLKGVLALFSPQYEIWGAHFASFILLIAAQIFVLTAVRCDYGDRTALIAAGLIMALPPSLWLAFEVRAYMLANLCLLMAAVYGLRLLDKPTTADGGKFAAAMTAALYTHYYCAVWLMFFCLFLLVILIRENNKAAFKKFLWAVTGTALAFAPWLAVPLTTGGGISQYWYVNMSFVKMSAQFFTTPLTAEMWQTALATGTVLSFSAFSTIVLCGLCAGKQGFDGSGGKKLRRLIYATAGTTLAAYLLLAILSVTVRPMVTSRYLMTFALMWYLAGAVALTQFRFLRNGFLIVAAVGFIGAYHDIRLASFDRGFYNLAHDVRKYISKDRPIVVFDNNNLFCEYYLPEYTCLSAVGERGEILRLPTIMENYDKYLPYAQNPAAVTFSLSSYLKLNDEKKCMTYGSSYRINNATYLCRLDAEVTQKLLSDSVNLRLHKYKSH